MTVGKPAVFIWSEMTLKSTTAQRRADQIKHKFEMRENSKHRKAGKTMKYMNNHFGQCRIFGNARCKIPMNLQFFAEGGEGEVGTGGTGNTNSSEGGNEENPPSVEELLATIAQKDAEYAKLKNTLDKKTSELSSTQKHLKAKMTAEEQEASAINERIAALEKENAEMKAQARISIYSKRYMGIGMDEKTAEALSELTGELTDTDKFFSALGKFVQSVKKQSGEDALQTYLKDNPDIKAGSGAASKDEASIQFAKNLAAQKSGTGINEDLLKKLM